RQLRPPPEGPAGWRHLDPVRPRDRGIGVVPGRERRERRLSRARRRAGSPAFERGFRRVTAGVDSALALDVSTRAATPIRRRSRSPPMKKASLISFMSSRTHSQRAGVLAVALLAG